VVFYIEGWEEIRETRGARETRETREDEADFSVVLVYSSVD